MRSTKLTGTLAVALFLTTSACGPRGAKLGGGKEGAAQALSQATAPLTRAPEPTGVDLLSLGVTVEVPGEKGGKVKIIYETFASLSGGGLSTRVIYDHYSEDGRTYYDGELSVKESATATSTLAAAELSVKGKLNLTGEVEDFLDVEVLERIAVSTGTAGDAVSITLKGSVRTSDDSHDFGGETMSFGIGLALPVAAKP